MVERFYRLNSPAAMWRMVLRPQRFQPVAGRCIRLGPGDAGRLADLYSGGEPNAFHPWQVLAGVFFGIEAGGRLVSAAGTHLVSPAYGVAALGNVFTEPDWRNRGYGAAVTSAVASGLLKLGIKDVVLNVAQANATAVRTYERLGFECYCPFAEALGTRLPGR